MFNDRGLNKEYLETNNIKKMYYNGAEIFRMVSFMPTLSVNPAELKFRKTGGTATIGVTSNTTWSASTSASWLTLTTAATGISATAPDYSSGVTERNTTILVTASNGDFTASETISVSQKVGVLPDVPAGTFIFNYNAKQYNPATYSFPKTEGQRFDQDLQLRFEPSSRGVDYVYIDNGNYYGYSFGNTNDNYFNMYNRNGEGSMTIIYKAKWDAGGDGGNIFANREGTHNYMARGTFFHTSASYQAAFVPSAQPNITYVRAEYGEGIERTCVTTNQTASSYSGWGGASRGVGFFAGYAGGGEYFYGDFYWMYLANTVLTDEQIQEVIDYNESL